MDKEMAQKVVEGMEMVQKVGVEELVERLEADKEMVQKVVEWLAMDKEMVEGVVEGAEGRVEEMMAQLKTVVQKIVPSLDKKPMS